MPLNEILAIACIVSFFAMLALGIPVALTLAVSGFVFGYIGFGSLLFSLLPARIYGVTANYTLIAIPLDGLWHRAHHRGNDVRACLRAGVRTRVSRLAGREARA